MPIYGEIINHQKVAPLGLQLEGTRMFYQRVVPPGLYIPIIGHRFNANRNGR